MPGTRYARRMPMSWPGISPTSPCRSSSVPSSASGPRGRRRDGQAGHIGEADSPRRWIGSARRRYEAVRYSGAVPVWLRYRPLIGYPSSRILAASRQASGGDPRSPTPHEACPGTWVSPAGIPTQTCLRSRSSCAWRAPATETSHLLAQQCVWRVSTPVASSRVSTCSRLGPVKVAWPRNAVVFRPHP